MMNMPLDPIPQGHIQLIEAWDLFRNSLWNGQWPHQEIEKLELFGKLPTSVALEHRTRLEGITDSAYREIVAPFSDGQLEALVRPPSASENYRIPPAEWRKAFFPERLFMVPTIGAGHGDDSIGQPDYWGALVGRTPLVASERFNAWLEGYLGKRRSDGPIAWHLDSLLRGELVSLVMDGLLAPKDAESLAQRWQLLPLASTPWAEAFDPLRETHWSLAMCVAWAVWRNADAVRESWEQYCRECWEWHSCLQRRPIDGGKDWWEVDGAELRLKSAATLSKLGLQEATNDVSTIFPQIMTVREARESLWARMQSGDLAVVGLDPAGDVVEVPPPEWTFLELAADAAGADFVLNRHKSLKPAYTDLRIALVGILRAWPPLKSANRVYASGQVYALDHESEHWTLFDAALWVGCSGEELNTDEIEKRGLENQGAKELFQALNQRDDLKATGLHRERRVREFIPREFWELATIEADNEGHFVSFVDDDAEGLWGTLRPLGDNAPRWTRIQVEVKALKRAFRFGRSKLASCRAWLEAEMRASPHGRPIDKNGTGQMTREKYREECKAKFNVGRSAFGRAWQGALKNVPEAASNWTKAGAPRKSPQKNPFN